MAQTDLDSRVEVAVLHEKLRHAEDKARESQAVLQELVASLVSHDCDCQPHHAQKTLHCCGLRYSCPCAQKAPLTVRDAAAEARAVPLGDLLDVDTDDQRTCGKDPGATLQHWEKQDVNAGGRHQQSTIVEGAGAEQTAGPGFGVGVSQANDSGNDPSTTSAQQGSLGHLIPITPSRPAAAPWTDPRDALSPDDLAHSSGESRYASDYPPRPSGQYPHDFRRSRTYRGYSTLDEPLNEPESPLRYDEETLNVQGPTSRYEDGANITPAAVTTSASQRRKPESPDETVQKPSFTTDPPVTPAATPTPKAGRQDSESSDETIKKLETTIHPPTPHTPTPSFSTPRAAKSDNPHGRRVVRYDDMEYADTRPTSKSLPPPPPPEGYAETSKHDDAVKRVETPTHDAMKRVETSRKDATRTSQDPADPTTALMEGLADSPDKCSDPDEGTLEEGEILDY
ncbi:MAG: hypothetical protein M1828_001915 [Chrysothrix sp. TS-e1954]|nr:MAG: hypothetical protein M1828_001915 [Chrysothrix sp. TS-e1954]